jgi:hypothetical protein
MHTVDWGFEAFADKNHWFLWQQPLATFKLAINIDVVISRPSPWTLLSSWPEACPVVRMGVSLVHHVVTTISFLI